MVLGVYAIGYICAQKASVAGCDRQKESEQDEFHTTKTEVLVTQPAALDVPSEVQQLLQRYVKETTALLGSQLEGIVLYGAPCAASSCRAAPTSTSFSWFQGMTAKA